MTLPFTKMQATGNDFVLVDNRKGSIQDTEFSKLARLVSDRKFGIGSDGLILLEDPGNGELVMHYRNPDGSDAGMCGNGARCFTLFARNMGYEGDILFRVHDSSYTGQIDREMITILFPLETHVIPKKVDRESVLQVYTNTEHIVCPVDAPELDQESDLTARGRGLRHHPAFSPDGTNVNFIHGVSSDTVSLQTYERGVEDLTLACGTGAIASALAWHHLQGGRDGHHSMNVHVKGGILNVHFTYSATPDNYKDIKLQGPATSVFEGIYTY